jgi:DNA-binding NtrC family response regulator
MPEPEEQFAHQLFESVYSPSRDLGEMLQDGLDRLADRHGLSGLTICLSNGHGACAGRLSLVAATLGDDGPEGCCVGCPLTFEPGSSQPGEACQLHAGDPSRVPCDPDRTVPIRTRSEPVGLVTQRAVAQATDAGYVLSLCRAMATLAARLVRRTELSRRAKERFGRELFLYGTSSSQAQLEDFLETAAAVSLPVLVLGEPGTGREDVAHALHLLGDRCEGPFVKLDCSASSVRDFEQDLTAHIRQADGGTLFLASVDELDYRLQSELADIVEPGLGAWWEAAGRGEAPDVRAVASASGENGPGGRRFHPKLRRELGLLLFPIEPLRRRREDVRHLVNYFLHLYAQSSAKTVSDRALELFESYHWPGNAGELRLVVARLAALVEGETVSLRDLRLHAPELRAGDAFAFGAGRRVAEVEDRAAGDGRAPRAARELARQCLAGLSAERLATLHRALVNALSYLAEKPDRRISLDQLARQAYVSRSHLSHLFREAVGMSPMAFVTLLRIEKAKRLLREKPTLLITEIAGQVGIDDLRHFERMFKRYVSMTPREFRSLTC